MKETSSDGVEKAYSIRCLILKAPKGKTAEMPVFLVKLKRGVARETEWEQEVRNATCAAGAGTFTKRWTKAYSPWRSKPVNMGV